ncbi:zinc finger protein 62 homolog isoform X2 [Parambassis ranga]|nr:zinc finger protein 62 homolog isoform X2 [Parambassis ranga]
MADLLKRGFRAQLTTTFDSILRRAMFEVTTIFENSLHDHQMELVQKGEEIAQLKIKLQTAELKLKDRVLGGDRGAEVTNTQLNETQMEPEVVTGASGQTSNVPEFEHEVPDEWCAPLGCEFVTKKEDDVCPSVRLRPFSIPLWPIPVLKQEAESYNIEFRQKDGRRSRKGSALNKGRKSNNDKKSRIYVQGNRRSTRNDKKNHQDLKLDLTGVEELRKRETQFTGKEQRLTVKSKKQQKKSVVSESKSTQQKKYGNGSEYTYSCKICKKVFDTEFGRSVHVRSHRWCRGCKRVFQFPGALKSHKLSCKKLKKILKKEAASHSQTSCDEDRTPVPSQQQVIVKKESTLSSHSDVKLSKRRKRFTCPHCDKQFKFRHRFKQHMLFHTGEKPFHCNMCPRKFHISQALKTHIKRIHRGPMSYSDTNGDVTWTKPLDKLEDNKAGLSHLRKYTSQEINHKKVEKNCSTDENTKWQTMGTRSPVGFTCLLCQKILKHRCMLIEHYRIHTGERPITCASCPAKFRTKAQLYIHKKKCGNPSEEIQCERCEDTFSSPELYNKHLSECQ